MTLKQDVLLEAAAYLDRNGFTSAHGNNPGAALRELAALTEPGLRRAEIFRTIEVEREYQETRHTNHQHSVGDWLTLMQHYLTRAVADFAKKSENEALAQMRKVVTLGVACFEQHGVPTRPKFTISEPQPASERAASSSKPIPTPECDKLSAAADKRAVIDDFLSWLDERHIELRYPPGGRRDVLILRFLQIDPVQLEKERQALMDSVRTTRAP